jgi:hypothetical protein
MDDATTCLQRSADAKRMGFERVQPQRIMLAMPFNRPQWQKADGQRSLRGAKFGGQHQFPLHTAFGKRHHRVNPLSAFHSTRGQPLHNKTLAKVIEDAAPSCLDTLRGSCS